MSDNIEIKSTYVLCNRKKETVYPIDKSDWEDIKDLLGKTTLKEKIYISAANICSGLFISSMFYLFTLYITENVKNWIIITSWVILFTSLFITIVSFWVEREHKRMEKTSIFVITERMKKIEGRLEKNKE